MTESDKFLLARIDRLETKIEAKIDRLTDALTTNSVREAEEISGLKVSVAKVSVIISIATTLLVVGISTLVSEKLKTPVAITPQAYYKETENGRS